MVERNRQGEFEERRSGERENSYRERQWSQEQGRSDTESDWQNLQSHGQGHGGEWQRQHQQSDRPGGYAQSYGGQQGYGQSQRGYEDQGEYRGRQAQQGYAGQQDYGRGQQWQQEPQRFEHYGGMQGYGGFMGHGSPDESRYRRQGAEQQSQRGEHDIPVYGSGRGPYARLAGYGAYSGTGPENYNVGPREHEGSWHGTDTHHGPQQHPSYGPYGGQPPQRDYGAYGAQGYGGEGGSGAQGYGGQGAYGRYGSQSDYGAPGGYAGDRVYRQGGPQHETGGGAHWGGLTSYGQGAYGGYGSGDMGRSTGQGGQSWGNWGDSGTMRRSQQRRGPKGYQRSDERLKEDICERLMNRWDIDTSEVTVNVSGGKVTLEGHVPDRRMRHEIENIVDDVYGVQDIENHLRVQSSYGSTSSGAAESNSQYLQSGSQQGSSQLSQSSPTAAQTGQDSSSDARMGSTTPSSAPARSASTIKKD